MPVWSFRPPSGKRLKPLGLMRMVSAGIDLQLAELLGPEAGLRQHALDRAPDDLLRAPLDELAEALALEALGMPAVPDVVLRLELVRAHLDPARVQDDH